MKQLLANAYRKFIQRTHVVDSKLPKSNHFDSSEVMIHAMFNMLVDHVEVEVAFEHRMAEYMNADTFKRPVHNWYTPFRDANAGTVALTLASRQTRLDDDAYPTPEADIAEQQLQLYFWWTYTRPGRPSLYVKPVPWDEFIDYTHGNYPHEILTADFVPQTSEEDNKRIVMKKYYDDEDTVQLRRLIAMRHTLIR